jgi:hypothetical protein
VFSVWDPGPLYAALVDAGFVVRGHRSIHDPESIRFLCDFLGAGDWHRQILSGGLLFQWKNAAPGPYVEPNNLSAVKVSCLNNFVSFSAYNL